MNQEDLLGFAFAVGGLFGFLVSLGLYFHEFGPLRRRAYLLGHRHGLAQAALPAYLQDLSNG
jgi:hypothetical protein